MLRVMELFAGVGGFRLGLEAAGDFDVCWTNQWEPSQKVQHAFSCYAHHFHGQGLHLNIDIAALDEEHLTSEPIDLIVGGFPCQDYSVARSLSGEKGITGKKGVLFWDIMRFIRASRPKYVLLENVDRLLKSPSKQRGRDFSIMLASFRDEDYSVEWRVINAADYGYAQRRRRIFIFAVRNDTAYVINRMKEANGDVLHKRGFFSTAFPIKQEIPQKHKPHTFTIKNDLLEISDEFSMTYLNAGIMRGGVVYTEEVVPIQENPTTLRDLLDSGVDERYYLSPLAIEKFEYLKGPKKIERTAATGHRYIFSEGGMAFPEPLDKPGRTMLTSEGTVNRSTHVVKDPETGRMRILTPVECERLNCFPDKWTEGMPERMRYFCMGNALVVGLIERMGKRILEIEQASADSLVLGNNESLSRRRKMIDFIKSLPLTVEVPTHTVKLEHDSYELRLPIRKRDNYVIYIQYPGKDSTSDNKGNVKKPYDFRPKIGFNDRQMTDLNFGHIFGAIEDAFGKNKNLLRTLAYELYRIAHLDGYQEVRYSSAELLTFTRKNTKKTIDMDTVNLYFEKLFLIYTSDIKDKDGNEIQISVPLDRKKGPKSAKVDLVDFLLYLDLIALNEDVAYFKEKDPNQGRLNNIYTIIHFIYLLHEARPTSVFAFNAGRRTNPIPEQDLSRFLDL